MIEDPTMLQPSPVSRQVIRARTAALRIGAVAALFAVPAGSAFAQPLARGNVPGEWRYWGADAWSTRYSPLDQINASNFNSLQMAWQWNAGGAFGEDEYYRTTPLFANGRLLTVATTRREAFAIDPA